MKSDVLNKELKSVKKIDLPLVFSSSIRPDVLLKVYESQKLIYSQDYGIKEGAGAQHSASGILKHRRHVWKTTYGKNISRVPRKIMSRNGASFNWVGATTSAARGGRNPHAPKSEKNRFTKINKKELLLALKTAFASTMNNEIVGSIYKKKMISGLIFDSSVLDLKTKDFLLMLKNALGEGYSTAIKIKKIRGGKGKMRGRKYKTNAGLLFVVSSDEKMKRAGIDVVSVKNLRVSDLSLNGVPGRLTCYTENAINEIGKTIK